MKRWADQITKYAETADCSVVLHIALTGSRYLTIDHARLSAPFVIRVSDHADAYATSAYSVDGVDGTVAGAKAFICKRIGTTDAAIRRLSRLRRRVAKAADNNRREAWILGWMRQEGVSRAEAEAKCPV
jgi:hypothetical protein